MTDDYLPAQGNAHPTAWFAVFVVPPPSHPLTMHGSRLIGYDIWSETIHPDEEADWPGFYPGDVSRIRALPRPYGVHITLGDALEYPLRALPVIAERLDAITRQLPVFMLRGGFYDTLFWDSVLALRWEEGINNLHRLAVATTVHINALRYRHGQITVPMTTYSSMLRDWAIETAFGRYWTIEKYYAHLTLANALTDRAERDRLWAAWQRAGHIAPDMSAYNLVVDRIYLMTRPTNSQYWIVHPDYASGFLLRG